MRAIVVGAGIGGLAAALSLRRAGFDVSLLEQARRFSEIGAGIQLALNATRELRRLASWTRSPPGPPTRRTSASVPGRTVQMSAVTRWGGRWRRGSGHRIWWCTGRITGFKGITGLEWP
ncbi:NAD(P)-binding protein [Streptomyces chartreusis]|uniref:NAD(P)-binding protein n=1 Tax=Streptomyces chartreusis TaxID=1969 RepID=UPI003630EEA4